MAVTHQPQTVRAPLSTPKGVPARDDPRRDALSCLRETLVLPFPRFVGAAADRSRARHAEVYGAGDLLQPAGLLLPVRKETQGQVDPLDLPDPAFGLGSFPAQHQVLLQLGEPGQRRGGIVCGFLVWVGSGWNGLGGGVVCSRVWVRDRGLGPLVLAGGWFAVLVLGSCCGVLGWWGCLGVVGTWWVAVRLCCVSCGATRRVDSCAG